MGMCGEIKTMSLKTGVKPFLGLHLV